MADYSEPSVRNVPFRVTDPERIPVKRYYDEAFYGLEKEQLWPRAWQMACRVEQIPNVGDWIEYSNLGKSVIVVRTREGIQAYSNACRHRGVQLASGHGNCEKKGFTCPFHGWHWNIEGENTFVYGRPVFSEHQLDHADLALPKLRTEEALGCVFINFDDDAPSFRDSIGPVVERLEAHALHKARAEWWYATELPANWKLAMEAFMEALHVMRTHPQLYAVGEEFFGPRYEWPRDEVEERRAQAGIPPLREFTENYADYLNCIGTGMAGMAHAKDVATARSMIDAEVPGDPKMGIMTWLGMLNDAVTRDGRARGEPTPDLNAVNQSHPVSSVEFIFPHVFFLPTLSSFSAYRIRPTGPESCRFEIWSLTLFPEGQEPAPVMEPTILPYDSKDFPEIPQQDYANIPLQQQGLHADGFEFMRLSRDTEGMISNFHRILDGWLAGLAAERVAPSVHKLGGNFDGPVLDLDL
ncbi:MAG TPA: aromatic ring-hydroxylating dioxygenase subunit alpha [Sphingobium sp.]|nr:aromatic ring-hydroxylating dioxygenase subunit alpha [Sphingobium sp.]